MLKNIYIFCLILLGTITVSAQNPAKERSLANQYFRDARLFRADAAYDQSSRLLRMSMGIYENLGMWSKYCSALSILSDNYAVTEQWDSVKIFQERLIASSIKHLGKNNRFEVEGYTVLGTLFLQRQQYDYALAFLNEALSVLKAKSTENQDLLAHIHTNIGLVYEAQQMLDKAALAFEEAETAIRNKPGTELPTIAKLYFSYARVLFRQGKYQKALEYAEKSKNVTIGLYTQNSHKNAEILLLLADIQIGMKQQKTALSSIETALDILNKLPKSAHLQIEAYRKMGGIDEIRSKASSLRAAWLKAVEIARKAYSDKHPEIGKTYLLLAEWALDAKLYDDAIAYCEAGEAAITLGKNEAEIVFLAPIDLLRLLAIRVTAMERLGRSVDFNNLKTNILQIHAQVQTMYLPLEMEAQLRKYNRLLCAALVGAILSREGNTQAAAEQALFWAELSKLSARRSLLHIERGQTSFGGLPDSLNIQWQGLKMTNSESVQMIINALTKANTLRYADLMQSWKQQRMLTTQWVDKFKKDYPLFYERFYNLNLPDFKNIAANLPKGQALLVFLEGEKDYYRIFCFDSKLTLTKLENASLKTNLKPIYSYLSLAKNSAEQANFEKGTQQLYKNLLPNLPKPEAGLLQLLIVPDGELWNLPFELLLTDETNNSFLIKQLAIRYLWTVSDVLPKESHCKGKDLSFFTTNYKNQPNNKYAALQPSYKTAKEWAKDLSVNHYRRYIHGDFQHNIHASESEFSGTNIAAFAALHLALYSEGDSENPMNSRIFMSFLPDSVSDGLLHAYELAQYQMPLSLLSIAALQDSFGFNDANAALMLAFAEVGVESVIWPQWATSDKYTRKLMLQFYKNLAAGMPKATALQQAKIALMEDNNSPYFWASHRLLGQDGVVSLRTRFRFPWLWVGGGAGLLGLLALLWFLRSRKA